MLAAEKPDIAVIATHEMSGHLEMVLASAAAAAYADYREMLAAEKPDIAVIATHEMSGHLEMVLASAPPAPTSTSRSRSPPRSARWTGCWKPAIAPACCW